MTWFRRPLILMMVICLPIPAHAFGYCAGSRDALFSVAVRGSGHISMNFRQKLANVETVLSSDHVNILGSGDVESVTITGGVPERPGDQIDGNGFVVDAAGRYVFKKKSIDNIKCKTLTIKGGVRVYGEGKPLEIVCEKINFADGAAILSDVPIKIRANKLVGKPILITLPKKGVAGSSGIFGPAGNKGSRGGNGGNGKNARCLHRATSGGGGGVGTNGGHGVTGTVGKKGQAGQSGSGVELHVVDGNELTGLLVIATGGDGGKGGEGGKGGDGGIGGDGGNGGNGGKARCGHGSRGGGSGGRAGNGGNGGKGGDGGNGGIGGIGGDVEIRFVQALNAVASDNLNIAGNFCVDVAGGLGGLGGFGGIGGRGWSAGVPGMGGQGGNGDIFNSSSPGGSGGHPGSPGVSGSSGNPGKPGLPGEAGSLGQFIKRKVPRDLIPKVIFDQVVF